MVRRRVVDLLECVGQILETPRQVAAVTHSHLEIEGDHYVFNHEVVEDDTWGRLYMGNCQMVDKERPLHPTSGEFIHRKHRVPISVVSDRDVRFTSRLCFKFDEELGTQLLFNAAYHRRMTDRVSRLFRQLWLFCCVFVVFWWELGYLPSFGRIIIQQ